MKLWKSFAVAILSGVITLSLCFTAAVVWKYDGDVVEAATVVGNVLFSEEGISDEITVASVEIDANAAKNLAEPVNTGEEYTFDSTYYPYRALLSTEGQSLYNQIYANAIVGNAEFTVAATVSGNEIENIFQAVLGDHPELYWLDTSIEYTYGSNRTVRSIKLAFNDLLGDEAAAAAFESALSSYISTAQTYSTVLEQETYVHDALCASNTYDLSASYSQSSYSALVNGVTVCAGYAKAFQLVMRELGVPCYYVSGTVQTENHAWNLISLNGEFYNVDLTWDDSIGEAYSTNAYTYFNLTDAEIGVDHVRDTLSSKLPSSGDSSDYQIETEITEMPEEITDDRLNMMEREMPQMNQPMSNQTQMQNTQQTPQQNQSMPAQSQPQGGGQSAPAQSQQPQQPQQMNPGQPGGMGRR